MRVRTRHVLKNLALPLAHRTGLLWIAKLMGGAPRRVALNYHNVDPAVFEQHATRLARTAHVVDVERFLEPDEAPDGKPLVVLTFDDGYAGFAERVVPILARHGLHAVWFVPTAPVAAGEVFWFDRVQAAVLASRQDAFAFEGTTYELSDWNRAYVAARAKAVVKRAPREDWERLVDALLDAVGPPTDAALAPYRLVDRTTLANLDPTVVTLGSHSHTHPQLTAVGDAALADELDRSRRLLEEWAERPVLDFAYPSGDHDDRTAAAARDAGYRSAWTTHAAFGTADDDPYRLPRIAIDDTAPVANLVAKTTPLIHRLGLLG